MIILLAERIPQMCSFEITNTAQVMVYRLVVTPKEASVISPSAIVPLMAQKMVYGLNLIGVEVENFGITYENLKMTNVETPILIYTTYDDKNKKFRDLTKLTPEVAATYPPAPLRKPLLSLKTLLSVISLPLLYLKNVLD
jgi:hypothetical protein